MSSPAIRMLCPNLRCRAVLAVPVGARGKNVRCRQCGTRIQVPEKSKTAVQKAAVSEESESK